MFVYFFLHLGLLINDFPKKLSNNIADIISVRKNNVENIIFCTQTGLDCNINNDNVGPEYQSEFDTNYDDYIDVDTLSSKNSETDLESFTDLQNISYENNKEEDLMKRFGVSFDVCIEIKNDFNSQNDALSNLYLKKFLSD